MRSRCARVTSHRARGWGCDLSGGVDSTSLCLLAHLHGTELVTLTTHHSDTAGTDARWADLAAAAMPGLDRVHLSPDNRPGYFSGIDQAHPPTDAPSPLPRGRAVHRLGTQQYTDRGVEVHLTGHGGDEVFAARTPTCTTWSATTRAQRRHTCAVTAPDAAGARRASCAGCSTAATTRGG
ncbi:asparagine synthase-related protein [Actinosynnema sp. NPDC050436]|uniref:asparagine synthase-related protein n=1 Tax=Actinosynnema sp. NPDC050436 TaxID=3155659 RepID=UPI0033EE3CF4